MMSIWLALDAHIRQLDREYLSPIALMAKRQQCGVRATS
jgi:hypothetical protein